MLAANDPLRNMKRYIVLFLLFIFSCTVSQAKDRLLVVTDEWAPFVFQENKVLKGFDYEVMMGVFSMMGYEVDFQILPWKRCVYLINQQQADAILDIGLNEQREKTMYFPEEKLSESSSVLFHLQGKQYKYENIHDLQGLKIGTIHGYEYSKEFSEANYFTKEPVETEEQNFRKLLLGRIDLFLVNKNVGLYNAKKIGILDKVNFISQPVSGGDIFIAFSHKEGHEKLTQEFSKHLKKYKMSDEFKSIMKKYVQ